MSKYCGKCGKENPDGYNFCHFCGFKLYEDKEYATQLNEIKLNNINETNLGIKDEIPKSLGVAKTLIGLGIALNALGYIFSFIVIISSTHIQEYKNIILFTNIFLIATYLIIVIGFILLLTLKMKSLRDSKILIGIGNTVWIFNFISIFLLYALYFGEYINASLYALFFLVLSLIGSSFLVFEVSGFIILINETKKIKKSAMLIGYGIISLIQAYMDSKILSLLNINNQLIMNLTNLIIIWGFVIIGIGGVMYNRKKH